MEDWDTDDVTVGVSTRSHWRALRYALARPRMWRTIPRILRQWRAPVYRFPDPVILKQLLAQFPDDDFAMDL